MICIFTYAWVTCGSTAGRHFEFAHADNRSRPQRLPYFWSAESRPLVKENEDAGD